MRRIKEKVSIDRTSLRVLAAVLVPGLSAASALGQQSSMTGPTKSGSGGALIKGHNEQGKNTVPGGGTGATGSDGGSAGNPKFGGDMRMTSGDGGGGDGGKLIDGVDEFIRRTSTGSSAGGDMVIPPPASDRNLLEPHVLPSTSAGGTVTGTHVFPVGTVPAPGSLGLVGVGLVLAVRRRRV